jgi:threonine/homoserine/homoserine lactone efflux protein
VIDIVSFGAEVISVSASGVFTPGPLFVANMMYSAGHGISSGIKTAHGHALIEAILIVIIATGLFSAPVFVANYADIIAVIGGVSIVGFAVLQVITTLVQSRTSQMTSSDKVKRDPFVAGIVFSAFNPFFILWWLTAGLKLVSDSATFGTVAGPTLLFGMHVWMDYLWLAATAYLASKGTMVLESKYYRLLMIGLAGLLAYYGVQFLMSGILKRVI